MEKYVEVINSAKVRRNFKCINSTIDCSKSAWERNSFYPNEGVVGVVVSEAYCYEGLIYIIQCADNIFVPILPNGIREITYAEFANRFPQNMIVGKLNSNQNVNNSDFDEIMSTIEKMFNNKM